MNLTAPRKGAPDSGRPDRNDVALRRPPGVPASLHRGRSAIVRAVSASVAGEHGRVLRLIGIDLFHQARQTSSDASRNTPPGAAVADRLAGDYRKYDVKPHVLLSLLDEGHEEVLWLDSDILICRDFRPLFADLPRGVLVVTEEALCSTHQDPGSLRTRLWKLPVGRTLPFTANSSVMRVTPAHRNLLIRWRSLLDDGRYRDAQAHTGTRPPHLLGDQDVLTAVLASSDFAHVPLRYLRRGQDILQFFGSYGYTARERLQNFRGGMPPFVHSQGNKPWWPAPDEATPSWYGRFNSVYLDLSPYTLLAAKYRDELTDPTWMRSRTRAGTVLRTLGCSYPPLRPAAGRRRGFCPFDETAVRIRLARAGCGHPGRDWADSENPSAGTRPRSMKKSAPADFRTFSSVSCAGDKRLIYST